MKIVVGIAAYREKQLLPTISSIFGRSSKEHEIVVCVCEQDETPQLNEEFLTKNRDVKSVFYHWSESKGCVWARKQAVSLIKEPFDYYLQIDGHSRLAQNWDKSFINYLEEVEKLSEYGKAVISNHPVGFNKATENTPEYYYNLLYYSELFFSGSILLGKAKEVNKNTAKITKSVALSAACLFSRANLLEEVVLDEKLYFHGEETSYFVRAWTRGYDFFHIPENLVYHDYNRQDIPKHWDDNKGFNNTIDWSKYNNQSINRFRILFRLKEGLLESEYDLGSIRTLKQFEDFAGINILEKATNMNQENIKANNYSINLEWFRKDVVTSPQPKKIEIYAVGQDNSLQIIDRINSENENFYKEEVKMNLTFNLIATLKNIRVITHYHHQFNLKSIKDYQVDVVLNNETTIFAKSNCGCKK